MNTCEFSPCRRHRYSLLHVMRPGGRRLAWIGLNPSTADEHRLDPTLTRIRAFSLAHGFGEFVMLNLFSFRSTDPAGLRGEDNLFTARNRAHLRQWVRTSDGVVFAWGATFNQWEPRTREQDFCVREFAGALCLGRTKAGFPRHPLYVRGNTSLEAFR